MANEVKLGVPAIELRDVSVSFGTHTVLKGVNLSVARGEVVAAIGPSGCGKSTLLNVVAGLVKSDGGAVEMDGAPIAGLNRSVAYMTQKDTLLPWLSVVDNVAMPLELAGTPKRERRARAQEVLEAVGVVGFDGHRPHQLSGGMRSRVSLARSLLSDASIFLMDEPFAAIDALRRVLLQQLLCDIAAKTFKTIVYVTHDLTEAIALADRIVVLGQGRIATTREVPFERPREVVKVRVEPEAQVLAADLWTVLENEMSVK